VTRGEAMLLVLPDAVSVSPQMAQVPHWSVTMPR
jgi:hypothetical protein